MAIEDLSTFDVRTTRLNSKLAESERKRHQFKSRLGPADPVFCCSCGRPNGFAAVDSPYIGLCRDCEEKFGGLPLLAVENVTLWCNSCFRVGKSVPRDLVDKLVYYCDDCEKKLGKPPLEEVPTEVQQALGVK